MVERNPLDYSHLSSLLRRLQDKWWSELLNKKYKDAAYTANDIEACAHGIANITHKIYEETLLADTTAKAGPDSGAAIPPARGDGR